MHLINFNPISLLRLYRIKYVTKGRHLELDIVFSMKGRMKGLAEDSQLISASKEEKEKG